MDIQTIEKALNERFAKDFREYYERRVIFWDDPQREFEHLLDSLNLENAILVKLTGRNLFAVKKLICFDEPTQNFLVYNPITYQKPDDDWLLNVRLQHEEFRAELASMHIAKLGLTDAPEVRTAVKQFARFFGDEERARQVVAMNKKRPLTSFADVARAVMASLCGLEEADDRKIVRVVLGENRTESANQYYEAICNYNARDAFWDMVKETTGYPVIPCDPQDKTLRRLAEHMLLTASTKTLPKSVLDGLESKFSPRNSRFCDEIVHDWLHSDDNERLCAVAQEVEEECGLPARFAKLAIEDLLETECFPCVDELVALKLLEQVRIGVDVKEVRRVVDRRLTKVWRHKRENYFECAKQIANMQEFNSDHSEGYHETDPRKFWNLYTTDYYKMDLYYRKFWQYYQNCLNDLFNSELIETLKKLESVVEGLYLKYLAPVSQQWTLISEDELAEHGSVLNLPEQRNFYNDRIKNREKTREDQKVFVIVSDAFRYEVAAELAERLRLIPQSQTSLESCVGIFPTITKFGMAALLPHDKLSVVKGSQKGLSVLADGQSTEAPNREKLLKQADEKSVAFKYEDYLKMSKDEYRSAHKGVQVVYIYHDCIDAASHTSESSVFSACKQTVDELFALVKKITGPYKSAKVYVTADHGFLYTANPLEEANKVGVEKKGVDVGRRHAITPTGSAVNGATKIRFLDGESEYEAYSPKGIYRFKISGSGQQYVHGGASLQETVVPIVYYASVRKTNEDYLNNSDAYDVSRVTLKILSNYRTVNNKIFPLNFYQAEQVKENKIAANYQLYFVDSLGNRVSDVQSVLADRTNENPQERQFRVTFTLKEQAFNKHEDYFLKIVDENGVEPEPKERFTIDVPLAADDLGF